VSWVVWGAASLLAPGLPQSALILLGTFAPGLLALGLTARSSGGAGTAALLRRLVDWEVPGRWYLFALLYVVTIKLTAALVHRLALGAWPRFGEDPWYLLLAATFASVLLGGQTGEELGWRGYALPRLWARFGLGGASVLLGVVWAAWHLPFFFVLADSDSFGQSFPLYLLQVVAISVAMAWLYAHTRGSLLPVMLLHSAINNTKDIVPSAEPGARNSLALSHSTIAWITVALLWACAGYFLVRMPRGLAAVSETAPRSG